MEGGKTLVIPALVLNYHLCMSKNLPGSIHHRKSRPNLRLSYTKAGCGCATPGRGDTNFFILVSYDTAVALTTTRSPLSKKSGGITLII